MRYADLFEKNPANFLLLPAPPFFRPLMRLVNSSLRPLRLLAIFWPIAVSLLGVGTSATAAALPPEPPIPATSWPKDAFLPLTEARIAALPAAEQTAWRNYWQTSLAYEKKLPRRNLADFSPMQPLPNPPQGASHSRGARLDAGADWYASEDARAVADRVVAWQTPAGGWTKSGDYSRDPIAADRTGDVWSGGTFDNDATITELRFLALVITATPHEAAERILAWEEAFSRGLDYTFAAQYPNGGFPQIYPLAGGYHDAITFNDDAMVHILDFYQNIVAHRAPFLFVKPAQAQRAATAGANGLACLLATQLKSPSGQRTVWCQQYDALTLRPCAARNFEPIAACSSESAGIAQFLMSIPQPSREIVLAVENAVDWLNLHVIRGVIWRREATTGTGLEPAADAPDLWARFYDIPTERPIFGDRDRSIHFNVTEISTERRKGYQWYTPRPGAVCAAYPAWRAHLGARGEF